MHGLRAAERARGQGRSRPGERADRAPRTGPRIERLGLLHLPLSRDRRLPAGLQFPAPAALRLRAGRARDGGPEAPILQRARFLAISEFGPRSLIYHEGRAYRVYKAKLPPGGARDEDGVSRRDASSSASDCGAAHDEERGALPRLRRARWPASVRSARRPAHRQCRDAARPSASPPTTRNGSARASRSRPSSPGRSRDGQSRRRDGSGRATATAPLLASIRDRRDDQPAQQGLRRRKEKSILGFGIDPATGRWTKAPDDEDDDDGRPTARPRSGSCRSSRTTRTRCCCGLPGRAARRETAMATLQHALLRGIEVEFQLEEGEILTEPLPSRDRRRAILAYEATEGGAGVLGRLDARAGRLRRVARAALELMHFERIDAAIAAGDPDAARRRAGRAAASKGCYRACFPTTTSRTTSSSTAPTTTSERILVALAPAPSRRDDGHAVARPAADAPHATALWRRGARRSGPAAAGRDRLDRRRHDDLPLRLARAPRRGRLRSAARPRTRSRGRGAGLRCRCFRAARRSAAGRASGRAARSFG